MRITQDSRNPTAEFEGDSETGNCIVKCPHCAHVYESVSQYNEPEYCPNCNKEVLYPGWAEW